MPRWAMICCAAMTLIGSGARAMPPSETLLPATTKGYISVPQLETLVQAWEQTDIGQLFQDPRMSAFAKDFERQLTERFGLTDVRIGIDWDDLRTVCSGEVCLAFLATEDAAQRHAIVALADVTDHRDRVDEIMQKVDSSMAARRATKRTDRWGDIPVTIYSVPVKQRGMKSFEAVLFTANEVFVAVDHPKMARDILSRLQEQNNGPGLDRVRAFQACMQRCAKEANGLAPHARWFVEPLGYAELAREATGNRRRKRSDILRSMRRQGFEAVEGIGGYVNLKEGPYEVLQRSFVFAPEAPGSGDRFKLAARILNHHRIEDLSLEPWVPANAGLYMCGTWGIQESYQYLGTFVDEVAGDEGFWDDLKDSLKMDPGGPQIDLDKDIIAHLGTRATAITDYTLPETPTSERFLVAIELSDPEKMRASIDKALRTDHGARGIEVDIDGKKQTIWEILEEVEETPELEIEGIDDLDLGIDENYSEEEEGPGRTFLANAAICVVRGHFIVASQVDFVRELIAQEASHPKLSDADDLKTMRATLAELGAHDHSAEVFSRVDELLRTSYELVRQGKMPESESLAGKVLNLILASPEENSPRKQRLDGSNLPPFEEIQGRLGTIGLYLKAEPDGWLIAGIGLAKKPEVEKVARPEKTLNQAAEQPADETELEVERTATAIKPPGDGD